MGKEVQEIRIADYNYVLPHEQIAAYPLPKRDDSRLLVYKSGNISDDHFYNLPQHLPEGATLVVNNTKVIEARILFQKATGGVIEIFCLEPAGASLEQSLNETQTVRWHCMVGGASKWKPGQLLTKALNDDMVLTARYLSKEPDNFIIEFTWTPAGKTFAEILHEAGNIPLPPYIKRAAQTDDATRYQTVFAEKQGSVAAPTAALHFTDTTFADLAAKGINTCNVTLHVGAGTFKPVKAEVIADHHMHAEHFQVTKKALQALINSQLIVAVGTTSLRTLESLHWIGVKMLHKAFEPDAGELDLNQWECYELEQKNILYKESLQALVDHLEQTGESILYCRTSLIIVPGYTFKSAMALVTNFHQPQSTLLLLVSGFIGEDWRRMYDHALQNGYRFLSYGDSSLLHRR